MFQGPQRPKFFYSSTHLGLCHARSSLPYLSRPQKGPSGGWWVGNQRRASFFLMSRISWESHRQALYLLSLLWHPSIWNSWLWISAWPSVTPTFPDMASEATLAFILGLCLYFSFSLLHCVWATSSAHSSPSWVLQDLNPSVLDPYHRRHWTTLYLIITQDPKLCASKTTHVGISFCIPRLHNAPSPLMNKWRPSQCTLNGWDEMNEFQLSSWNDPI